MRTISDGILGLVTGDALGVPAEFREREMLRKHPVTEMTGYGTWNQPAGTWSDDSSMTLCTAETLLNGYDLNQIAHSFVRWMYEAHWTPHGEVFDVGTTTSRAIEQLKSGTAATEAGQSEEHSNGNGSLMRILPLLYLSMEMEDIQQRYGLICEVSAITHAHERSCLACFYYLEFAAQLLMGETSLLQAYGSANRSLQRLTSLLGTDSSEVDNFARILKGNLQELPEHQIRTEGYVLYTLEASLYCLLNTHSFKDAVLKAVNLGEDTDTTAAVVGGLAGIYYGKEAIPQEWLQQLARLDDIEKLLGRLDSKYVAGQSS